MNADGRECADGGMLGLGQNFARGVLYLVFHGHGWPPGGIVSTSQASDDLLQKPRPSFPASWLLSSSMAGAHICNSSLWRPTRPSPPNCWTEEVAS